MRLRQPGGVKQGIVKAANVVIDNAVALRKKRKASPAKSTQEDDDESSPSESEGSSPGSGSAPFTSGANKLWVSVARYDDRLVEFLERWEAHTRHTTISPAVKDTETTAAGEGDLRQINEELKEFKFDEEGTWDRDKMVRNFARFGVVQCAEVMTSNGVPAANERDREQEEKELEKLKAGEGEKKVWEYALRLSDDKRARVKVSEPSEKGGDETAPTITVEGAEGANEDGGDKTDGDASSLASSAVASSVGLAKARKTEKAKYGERGLIVEASRELRMKLYVGKVRPPFSSLP